MPRQRYHLTLPEPGIARGPDPSLSFHSQAAEGFAAELQDALRSPALFERWRQQQDDPEAADPALGGTDPSATVSGEQRDLKIDLLATTSLSGQVLKHRLRLLAGSAWQLRDVSAD